jgi:ABC-2 type transport system ATP-binding protein
LTKKIEITNLRKEYGNLVAVDSLFLEVFEGEIFGFLGPNGAGKTTTVRMLTTLTKPTSGTASIFGFDVVKEPVKAKMDIGVITQYINVDVELTATENLEVHGMLYGMRKRGRRDAITKALKFVDLYDRRDSVVSTFSGGMKRRLMIALALMHRPKVLFMDEPTVGLDPQTRRRIWDIIKKISAEGATIFLTTHYIEEAELICKRVGIIDHGKLIALGTPLSLIQKAGTVVVETLGDDGTEYSFFNSREEAGVFVGKSKLEVVVRNANLEDVFINLTGRRVSE